MRGGSSSLPGRMSLDEGGGVRAPVVVRTELLAFGPVGRLAGRVAAGARVLRALVAVAWPEVRVGKSCWCCRGQREHAREQHCGDLAPLHRSPPLGDIRSFCVVYRTHSGNG